MVSCDNSGEKTSEIHMTIWPEGGSITTSTVYSNHRAVMQHITTRDRQGNVNTREGFGGKLIPWPGARRQSASPPFGSIEK